MNAIVVTPTLCGWGFPPRANVARLVRKPRREALGWGKKEDFRDWLRMQPGTPDFRDVCARFHVSRATAYRWLADIEREAA